LAWSSGAVEATERDKLAFYLKTTEDLQILCTFSEDHELYGKGIGFCYGFISGIMSFYGAIADAPSVPKVVCSDTEIARSAMVENFIDWSGKHPEHLQDAPVDSVVRSAMQKWPCPENN
jgi:hypothetical protein